MKRYIAMLLAWMMLLLCGCGASAPVEPDPTPTPEPTPTPAPQYVNPLNGEILDAPYTGRIFASTVCNTPNAIPHISLNEADIVFESFVNGSVIRNIALYSNIQDVEVFGSVRSARLIFHQLAQMYDFILIHSGGSYMIIEDAKQRGFDNFNIDNWYVKNAGTSYRDKEYKRSYEAALFGLGQGCYDYAVSQGMRVTQPEGMDYGLDFVDEGTPVDGESANLVSITFKCDGSKKLTEMKYDAELDKYVYWQYEQEMRDQITDEPEAFKNVVIVSSNIFQYAGYHVAAFEQGGTGWYACGGKLIPITWSLVDGNIHAPLEFYTADGQPLEMERGNTYIALAPLASEISWE